MMACASRRTRRSTSALFFLGIREFPHAIRLRCHRYRNVRDRKRSPHVLRPLAYDEIARILQELRNAKRQELIRAREAVCVNVDKPREWASRGQVICFEECKRRACHSILDSEPPSERLCECRLPRPEFSGKRHEKRSPRLGAYRLCKQYRFAFKTLERDHFLHRH